MRKQYGQRDSYNRNAYFSSFRGKMLHLPEHDYSAPCVYHVIICAQGVGGREPLFEDVVLSRLLKANWVDLPARFPSIQLDEFVVMPDHVHFLIWVNKWPERLQRGRPPYLWEILQAYKSKVAIEWIEYVKTHCPEQSAKIWQKKYYERMVRVDMLDRVRCYIRENPEQAEARVSYVRWEKLYERMGWERPFSQ